MDVRYGLTALLLCVLIVPKLAVADLTQDINVLVEKNLPFADVGIQVEDAQTGELLYQHNSFQVYTPASNTKLFTAAAALYGLGKDYRYTTSVNYDRSKLKHNSLQANLYIKFTGDPSLRVNDLDQLIDRLSAQGIKQIDGNIVIDDTRFQLPGIAPGVSYDDMPWSYAAPVDSIILNENALQTDFIPSQKLNGTVRINSDPSIPGIKIESRLRTVTYKEFKKLCGTYISFSNFPRIIVSGCYPMSTGPQHEILSIPHSLWLARQIIATRLKQNNIILHGKIVTGTTPKTLPSVVEHNSQPLFQLVEHMLQHSDNTYANSFFKTLGWRLLNHGTYKAGSIAVKQILQRYTNIDFSQMELADGAGNRYNLISPQQITSLLLSVYHDPTIRDAYISALPRAGESGTLHWRMLGYRLLGHVNAKTGTMHDVSALSGYLTTPSKRELIFSILINHVVGGIAPAKRLEEKVCDVMARDIG